MKRIGMGIVGAGFVGPHHVDAVRRLGFVDVVAVAGSSESVRAREGRRARAPKAYGSFEALIADPDVHVVHNATPNYLHARVNAAAIAAGKHIISDKPLAMSGAEARDLLDRARGRGCGPRRHVQLPGQSARAAGARFDRPRRESAARTSCTAPICRTGSCSTPTTRGALKPDKGGPTSALGDVGSHWCDLAEHITGLRISEVLADVTTTIRTRKKPAKPETFQATRTPRPRL
jgi:predicted dehydrogenase